MLDALLSTILARPSARCSVSGGGLTGLPRLACLASGVGRLTDLCIVLVSFEVVFEVEVTSRARWTENTKEGLVSEFFGQGLIWQIASSDVRLPQTLPPFLSNRNILRVRFMMPGPQCAEQELQRDQWLHLQWT